MCPIRLPLPKMMRSWRQHDYAMAKRSELPQRGLRMWAWLARRPALYHRATSIGARLLRLVSGSKGLPNVGFLNPSLYTDESVQASFRDVVVGGTDLYQAAPGWDYPTGWGAPRAMALAENLP